MGHYLEVIFLSIGMFLLTFTVGFIPTKIQTSQKVMNLISIFGAGLLVGAALIVIVPEGMIVLYQSMHNQAGAQTIKIQAQQDQQDLSGQLPSNSDSETDELVARYVGISLIIGFAAMMFIDQGFSVLKEWKQKINRNSETLKFSNENKAVDDKIISQTELATNPSTNKLLLNETSVTSIINIQEPLLKLEKQEYGTINDQENNKSCNLNNSKYQKESEVKENVILSTVGLVIHSIADGLALGASLFLSDESDKASGLGILIFLAILLHKAPAAVGFGTFLYHEGLRGFGVAKYLFAFTISCPLTAILGYLSLMSFNSGKDANTLMFWVGILLLISAGSFIYVATIHILPEVYGNNNDSHGHEHSEQESKISKFKTEDHYSKGTELFVMMIGLITPYFLMLLHQDE